MIYQFTYTIVVKFLSWTRFFSLTSLDIHTLGMNVDGWRGRGRPKKRWMDCVANVMLEKGVDDAMAANRGE